MIEYAIVRMDRPEAGERTLSVDDSRRCRYYITALNEAAAMSVALARWPKESFATVANKPAIVHVFPEEKKSKNISNSNAFCS